MKCLTCYGKGTVQNDMYHPAVVCIYCQGSGIEKEKIMDGQEFDEKGKPVDMVNHPSHYTFGTIEVIDVIEDWQLGFHEGNCVKYIARAKHKGNELEDLKKAEWYLNRKINQLDLNKEK